MAQSSTSELGAIDDEAVPDVAEEHALVGVVDSCGCDALDVARDAVRAAVIEHLLRLPDAADERAHERSPAADQRERLDLEGIRRRTDQDHRAVALEAAER